MRVRVLKTFKDLSENKLRKLYEEFDATKNRVEKINSTHYGTLVEVIEEPTKDKIDDEMDMEELTIKEIKELLDQMGIEYNSKLKKYELIELLKGGE